MGADIHCFAEVKRNNNKWYRTETPEEPFGWRSYAVFGFLAGVRNYSECKPISEPRGLPCDSEYLNTKVLTKTKREYILGLDYFSHSYLTLKELIDFDYNQTFWDRRVTKQVSPNMWNGAAKAEPGEGQIITYREHLGEDFFKHIEMLQDLGSPEDVRIVFYFDN